MAVVTMYASSWCGYCARAKALLESKRVAYREISVDGDAASRREMMALSGRKSVPQIFIDERHLGGYDDLSALERTGELDALLAADQ